MNAYNHTKRIVIAKRVERAHSILTRMKGLLGRAEMEKDFALWLSPAKSIHTFFMKFPIDVIFLSSTNQVVKVLKSVKPFRAPSFVLSSSSILELSENTIEETKTEVGDQIIFRL